MFHENCPVWDVLGKPSSLESRQKSITLAESRMMDWKSPGVVATHRILRQFFALYRSRIIWATRLRSISPWYRPSSQLLFVLIMVSLVRRRVLHVNVTAHPTPAWSAQQVVEAAALGDTGAVLLWDRDTIYGHSFRQRVAGLGLEEVVTAARPDLNYTPENRTS